MISNVQAETQSDYQSSDHEGYLVDSMDMRPVRQDGEAAEEERVLPTELPRSLAIRLYTSHFLSTWNSRLFEFGAVLFLASIFPDTLLPMSVYALVRSASAILFAQSIGSWIDRGDRLKVVRFSIIGQRLAVAASCAILWNMERKVGLSNTRITDGQFALVVLLACVEKQPLGGRYRPSMSLLTISRSSLSRRATSLYAGHSMLGCDVLICFVNFWAPWQYRISRLHRH